LVTGGVKDRLHQPYRQALIPGYEAVGSAAVAAGALGMVISGAGPTLLALVDAAQATEVAAAMGAAWQEVE
jgi:homoserine kinase